MEQEKTISWKALPHEHEHKDPDWFWGIGIAATAIAIIAILLGNPLFAFLVAVGAITLFMHAIKKPRMIEARVDDDGITVDTATFPFETLVSFSVTESEHRPILILKSKQVLTPRIVIPLKKEDKASVQKALRERLSEEKLEIPVSYKLLEFLGL